MEAFEVVRRLRARQAELVEALPPALLREYHEIESTVKSLDRLILENGAATQVEEAPRLRQMMSLVEGAGRGAVRVALAERREALREYLRANGPTQRGQILEDTGIPPGTLSVLLTESAFQRVGPGVWRLMDE